MVKPSELFSSDEIAALKRKSDWRGAWLIAHAWCTIFAAMALFAWWPNPLTFVLGVAVVAGRQLGLAILMHDAAHKLLFNSGRMNDRVAQWLCAYPVIADLGAYRPYHLTHHRFVQSAADPDLGLSAPFPTTRDSFRRKVLRDLSGQTAFKQRRALLLAALGTPEQPITVRIENFRQMLLGPILVNVALFAALAAIGYWWLYPVMWVIPLATVYQLISRVRNIAEHAMIEDDEDVFRNARTTYAGVLERILCAPYWVNYHMEHHLLMWVPCYNLPKAHAALLARGFGPRIETKPGYLAVLRQATALQPVPRPL
jgi:fatty acid desaturase